MWRVVDGSVGTASLSYRGPLLLLWFPHHKKVVPINIVATRHQQIVQHLTQNRMIVKNTSRGRKLSSVQTILFSQVLPLFLAFVLGIVVGRGSLPRSSVSSPHNVRYSASKSDSHIHGSIHRLSETPFRNTSHIDNQGRPIVKQQFLEPFAIPFVAGYSVATILPGQNVPLHEHESMHEFFYVLRGTGIFILGSKTVDVSSGTFLHMSPHEPHGIMVPADSRDGDLIMLVSGVVIE